MVSTPSSLEGIAPSDTASRLRWHHHHQPTASPPSFTTIGDESRLPQTLNHNLSVAAIIGVNSPHVDTPTQLRCHLSLLGPSPLNPSGKGARSFSSLTFSNGSSSILLHWTDRVTRYHTAPPVVPKGFQSQFVRRWLGTVCIAGAQRSQSTKHLDSSAAT
jgi:hypothetical protein